MAHKKHKRTRAWWRRKKTVRRLLAGAVVAGAVVALAVGFFLSRGGGHEAEQNLAFTAPSFDLPTIAGDDVSLADHRDQHALLLYFNEGMG